MSCFIAALYCAPNAPGRRLEADLLESTDATAAAGKLVAEVLASPAVVKVGVNLAKDVDELFDEAPSLGLARGRRCATRLVDLSGAVASALGVSHADAIGLKRLALLLLGLKLDRAMARSDWSCRPLSDAQVARLEALGVVWRARA